MYIYDIFILAKEYALATALECALQSEPQASSSHLDFGLEYFNLAPKPTPMERRLPTDNVFKLTALLERCDILRCSHHPYLLVDHFIGGVNRRHHLEVEVVS